MDKTYRQLCGENGHVCMDECLMSFLFFQKLPGSNFYGKTPLFFRYSGVNAATAVNAFIPTSKTPLTPLYRQGTPLTPLAFRLNAVNAVIPEKTCVFKKSDFLTP